jgi:hypothetical protein
VRAGGFMHFWKSAAIFDTKQGKIAELPEGN